MKETQMTDFETIHRYFLMYNSQIHGQFVSSVSTHNLYDTCFSHGSDDGKLYERFCEI